MGHIVSCPPPLFVVLSGESARVRYSYFWEAASNPWMDRVGEQTNAIAGCLFALSIRPLCA